MRGAAPALRQGSAGPPQAVRAAGAGERSEAEGARRPRRGRGARFDVLACGAALGVLAAGCRPVLPAGDPVRPDIVLVSIDSLRADHLGAWGYGEATGRETSPFLDRLAAAGTRFADARSASPWTLPSHWTMLTGRWPWEHGVVEDSRTLPEGAAVLPQALADAGYATAAFTSTVYVSRAFGFQRGFQHFEDYGISTADNLDHPVRADRQVDDALGWARESAAGRPAFLFLHLYDAHYPYDCPAPWDTRFDRAGREGEARYRTYAHYKAHPLGPARLAHQVAQYDECIAWTDAQLARLHATWAESGRRAVFVVTADHGEELGERGSWGHAHTLAPEQLHVPLIVAGDGIPAGAVRAERAGTVDLAATIAGIAGVTFASHGVDLRGTVPARPFGGETARFDSARLSWEDGPWRLDVDVAQGEVALHDHAHDPGEQVDLAAREPVRVEAMRVAMQRAVDPGTWTLDAGARATFAGPVAAWGADGALLARPDARTVGAVGTLPFGLWPPDLAVDVAPSGALRRVGVQAAAPVALDAELRQGLEALGYVQ